jgi:hypothetical protein
MSGDEIESLKSRALHLGCEAWLAQMTIKTDGSAMKTIIWTKLE